MTPVTKTSKGQNLIVPDGVAQTERLVKVPTKPGQDQGLKLAGAKNEGIWVTAYNDKMALDILNLLAEGHTLRSICTVENGFCAPGTFRRWCVMRPELSKAYHEAVKVSAVSLEEEALDLARRLKEPDPGTSVEVRAKEVAMTQFRWSASRRDPTKYGERALANIVVPIQINTGLDLGQAGAKPSAAANIYEVKATVPTEIVIEKKQLKLSDPRTRKRPGPQKVRLTPREPKK